MATSLIALLVCSSPRNTPVSPYTSASGTATQDSNKHSKRPAHSGTQLRVLVLVQQETLPNSMETFAEDQNPDDPHVYIEQSIYTAAVQ